LGETADETTNWWILGILGMSQIEGESENSVMKAIESH